MEVELNISEDNLTLDDENLETTDKPKKLPHRMKTIRQNQQMRLRLTQYNPRSAAKVGSWTHIISLFINDLPNSLRSAETYLYADDTIYCIAETMDLLTNTLNNVLAELQKWCNRYLMIPHPVQFKAMIVQPQSSFIGPIQALHLGNNTIKWKISERLLGVQVVNKLSWSDHAANVAKSFASKLSYSDACGSSLESN